MKKARHLILKCFLLSGLTLGATFIIDSISKMQWFKVLFPEILALEDFEYSDFGFLSRPAPTIDSNIVIINIGYLDRAELARQLRIVNSLSPKAIGYDVLFSSSGDSGKSEKLKAAINATRNCVLAMRLLQSKSLSNSIAFDEIAYDSSERTHHSVKGNAIEGFVNLFDTYITHNIFGYSGIKAARVFTPKFDLNHNTEIALSIRLALACDSAKANQFLQRKNLVEAINFRGSIEVQPEWPSPLPVRYRVIDWTESLDSLAMQQKRHLVQDKIVLFGFLGQYLDDLHFQDMFYTPLNNVPLGKSLPDMYGAVIHANIISMILNEDYIDTLSGTGEYLVAFLACLLHILVLLSIQKKFPKGFDYLSLIIIIAMLVLLANVRIGLFYYFNIKANLTITLGTLAIAGFIVSQHTHFFRKKNRTLPQ